MFPSTGVGRRSGNSGAQLAKRNGRCLSARQAEMPERWLPESTWGSVLSEKAFQAWSPPENTWLLVQFKAG